MNNRVILKEAQESNRAGDGKKAARLILTLNTSRVERDLRLPFAVEARRCGQFSFGLRLLTPLVHADWPRDPASMAERAEYAVLLQKVGGAKEALQILNAVDPNEVPEAHLFRAFCLFGMWDYDAALPELNAYLKKPMPEYARLVGQVNLASTLVNLEKAEAACQLLEEISAKAAAGGHTRLLANCCEMRAQTYILSGDWNEARRQLRAASEAFAGDDSHDRLFVRKWSAVLEALSKGDVTALGSFRAEAMGRRHWESVREADLYFLKASFDPSRLEFLYAGTPFPAYRTRIAKTLGLAVIPRAYRLGAKDAPVFDLGTGDIQGGLLPAGGKIHRLYSVLLRDLYRPLKLAGIFGELFPGEYFNIESSPDRVHQVLRRARRWSQDAGFGDLILEDSGDYSVDPRARLAFLIPAAAIEVDKNHLTLTRLTAWAAGRTFSAASARTALGMSSSAFGRFTLWAVENAELEKHGGGPRTLYRLKKGARAA